MQSYANSSNGQLPKRNIAYRLVIITYLLELSGGFYYDSVAEHEILAA